MFAQNEADRLDMTVLNFGAVDADNDLPIGNDLLLITYVLVVFLPAAWTPQEHLAATSLVKIQGDQEEFSLGRLAHYAHFCDSLVRRSLKLAIG